MYSGMKLGKPELVKQGAPDGEINGSFDPFHICN